MILVFSPLSSKVFYPFNILGKNIFQFDTQRHPFRFRHEINTWKSKEWTLWKIMELFSKNIFLWIWIMYWKYKILNKKSIYETKRTHFLNMSTKIAPIHPDNNVKTLLKIGGVIFISWKYFLFWMIVTNYQILGICGVSTTFLIKTNFFSISKS